MGLVKYIGGIRPGVTVRDPDDGAEVYCPYNTTVDVSDALETQLLLQPTMWNDGGDGAPAYTPDPETINVPVRSTVENGPTADSEFVIDIRDGVAGEDAIGVDGLPVSVAGGSGLPQTIVTKTSAYTAAAGELVRANAASGGFTVTLPASPDVGRLVAVKKIDATSNTVTVAPSGGGTIDGQATATTATQWAGAVFEHVGSNVWVIAASMSTTGPAGTNGTNGTNGIDAVLSIIQDEGSTLTQRSTLNFVGSGVTAADAGGKTVVTIPGASGGGGGLAPGALPSGRYVTTPGSVSTMTPANNTKYAFPFTVYASTAFSAIGINVSTLQAGSTVRLGVYADDGTGKPGNLVFDAGTVDSSSTGMKEIAITQTLPAGTYWLCARTSTSGVATSSTGAMPVVIGATSQAGAMTNSCCGFSDAGAGSGALESTWGSTYGHQTNVPRVVLKTA